MENKSAEEQINILENITIQILQGAAKEVKKSTKVNKYSA